MLQIKYKELVFRWLKTVAAGFIIVFIALLLTGIILGHSERMAPFKPLLSEAKALDLTFDQVAKEPDKFLGKHVIWCVRNKAKNEVYYKGEPKRFTVENHEQMPLVFGSKHSSCESMLLQIKSAERTPSGSSIPSVRFVTSL